MNQEICDWCKGNGEYKHPWFDQPVWCGKCRGTGRPVIYDHYSNGDEIDGRVNPDRFPGQCEVWFLGRNGIMFGILCGYGPVSEVSYEERWKVVEKRSDRGIPIWPPSEAITQAADWRQDEVFCAAVKRICEEVANWKRGEPLSGECDIGPGAAIATLKLLPTEHEATDAWRDDLQVCE